MSDDLELKKRFAEKLLKRPKEAYTIAVEMFGFNQPMISRCLNDWAKSPEIFALQSDMIDDEGEEAFLPSKSAFMRRILDVIDDTLEDDAKLKAMRLYAECAGYIQKAGVMIDARVDARCVMLVKDHGDDDEWEKKLIDQQRKLIDAR